MAFAGRKKSRARATNNPRRIRHALQIPKWTRPCSWCFGMFRAGSREDGDGIDECDDRGGGGHERKRVEWRDGVGKHGECRRERRRKHERHDRERERRRKHRELNFEHWGRGWRWGRDEFVERARRCNEFVRRG